jgi:hypothetical protein
LHSNLIISVESILRKVQLAMIYTAVYICVLKEDRCMHEHRGHHVWPNIPFGERNLDVSSDPLTQTRLHTFANARSFRLY